MEVHGDGRPKACQECHRLRVKCETLPGEKACKRCLRIGKKCAPAVSKRRKGMKRVKSACSECHRLRHRCLQRPDDPGGSCERCARLGKKCLPRHVLSETSVAGEKTEVAEAQLRATQDFLRLFRSGHVMPNEHSTGAEGLVKIFNALKLNKAPRMLEQMIQAMIMVGKARSDPERLRLGLSLANSVNIPRAIEALNAPLPERIDSRTVDSLCRPCEDATLLAPLDGASMISRSNSGHRELTMNVTFEWLFGTLQEALVVLNTGGNAILDFWQGNVEDPNQIKLVMAEAVKSMMVRGKCFDKKFDLWGCNTAHPSRIRVRDRAGAAYSVLLNYFSSFALGGRFSCVGVAFRDLRPLDAAAEKRLADLRQYMNEPASRTKPNIPTDANDPIPEAELGLLEPIQAEEQENTPTPPSTEPRAPTGAMRLSPENNWQWPGAMLAAQPQHGPAPQHGSPPLLASPTTLYDPSGWSSFHQPGGATPLPPHPPPSHPLPPHLMLMPGPYQHQMPPPPMHDLSNNDHSHAGSTAVQPPPLPTNHEQPKEVKQQP